MITKEFLKTIDANDKESFLQTLEEIIQNTYVIEKEFIELKNILAKIIEVIPNAIWVLDKENEIYLSNSATKNIAELIQFIDTTKSDYELEFKEKIFLIKSTKSNNDTIITATDITDQKRSERLASMGQVASHLAHEIRNPIGSISIFSSTLLNRVTTKNKPIVLEIKKAIYRVERIIKSTLLFTKGVKVDQSLVSLKRVIEDIEDSYEHYSFTKEIDLKFKIDEEKKIFVDLDSFSIVVQNFLYNAIDAIEENENDDDYGVVEFSHEENKTYDIITIKDSGREIEDEKILFEPFKTTKTKGHGLGLALSLEIIKAHNGKIELLKPQKGFKIFIKKDKR
jgi:two-component system sensor histidine kinase AtoS